jgi:hypothetical protein
MTNGRVRVRHGGAIVTEGRGRERGVRNMAPLNEEGEKSST